MWAHVLVGTDGSETATSAVEAAARLAQAHQARLTIAYAFAPKLGQGATVGVPTPEETWRATPGGQAESVVSDAAAVAQMAACGGLRIATRVEPGPPVVVLAALVHELQPDAVVVGNADLRKHRLRRGIGQALARRVTSDVVIVDTLGRAAPRPAA